MRLTLAAALTATALLTGCAHTVPQATNRAPHCTTVTVRSIAGIYCQSLMPSPYLDPIV
jgi:hypothetical protein